MLTTQTLEKYVNLFFGYGRWNAPIWFVGIEEAGGRDELEIERRISVWNARGRKELEDAPSFYPETGNDRWHGSRATLQPTWAQLIRMLLIAQGKADAPGALLDYQRAWLGSVSGDSCLLELLPLPSPNIKTWNYREWSEIPWLRSREVYQERIIKHRLESIRERMDRFRPRAVIFYGDGQLRYWQQIIGHGQYSRPIAKELISHERDNIVFFVTKHPTNPELQFTADEYFHRIGVLFRDHYGLRFSPR